VLRDDAKLLAPEETPEEILREQQERAAALVAVQDRLRSAAGAAGAGGASGSSKRGRDVRSGDDSDSEDEQAGKGGRTKPGGASAVVAERVKGSSRESFCCQVSASGSSSRRRW